MPTPKKETKYPANDENTDIVKKEIMLPKLMPNDK